MLVLMEGPYRLIIKHSETPIALWENESRRLLMRETLVQVKFYHWTLGDIHQMTCQMLCNSNWTMIKVMTKRVRVLIMGILLMNQLKIWHGIPMTYKSWEYSSECPVHDWRRNLVHSEFIEVTIQSSEAKKIHEAHVWIYEMNFFAYQHFFTTSFDVAKNCRHVCTCLRFNGIIGRVIGKQVWRSS